ncbi:hypothetical protein D6C78_04050 [Aureobasidium pullulans]|uniref:Uncharacterized protein n=2 Tax=Aureobasidium pullulans TaxID=5580 RepID=A0A4T0BUA2_AURPU|nr:hypothetical protein D6C78_04050 [Aureobasidium pullulans]
MHFHICVSHSLTTNYQTSLFFMFNALIRTHHITSRKKVTKLKQAADATQVFALLRSGSSPGIMYVEGEEKGVRHWVDTVHNLRYKDYQLVARPAAIQHENQPTKDSEVRPGLYETETVSDFGKQLQDRGVYAWWRKAMGYAKDE